MNGDNITYDYDGNLLTNLENSNGDNNIYQYEDGYLIQAKENNIFTNTAIPVSIENASFRALSASSIRGALAKEYRDSFELMLQRRIADEKPTQCEFHS